MSDSLPQLTVTMLGPSGSGKTGFLLGMYAAMSIGVADYFLHARDNDLDLDLTQAWEQLLVDNKLPNANAIGDLLHYPLMLKAGNDPVLAIDWLDYRGNAMYDAKAQEDVAALQARLAVSDAIYLVIDGVKLREGVRDDNVLYVDMATRANRMRALVHNALTGRRWPPMVIVVTKSDLFGADNPGRPDEEIADEIVAAVRRLLPICFQDGVTTMVCPVSLGDFGADPQDRVARPGSVRLINMHKPLLFSLSRTLQQRVARTTAGLLDLNHQVIDNIAEKALFENTLFARFRTGKRDQLAKDRAGLDSRVSTAKGIQATDRDRIRKLAAELRDTHVFIDGEEAEWTLE